VSKARHPAEKYIEDVISGRVVAGKFVRLAVERHVRDLEQGAARGLRFDRDAAIHAIEYFQFTCHSKGEWAGKTFVPSPWQMFIHWCVFGWYRADGTRRFREVYEEVARKNGKTTKLSGTGLYLLDGDGEPGADVYAAATKRDQARLTHLEARKMVKSSPLLKKRMKVVKDNIHVLSTNSKFEPLGADADTTDGLNVQGGLIDELHAHKTRDLCDKLETATSSRRQPIIWYITTAGHNHESICWEKREYVRKVLTGIIVDDSVFGIIFTLDTKLDWPELLTPDEAQKPGATGAVEDRWDDPKVWVKANPNLGVSVKLDDLQRKALKAAETPGALNAFLQLHLNVWTSAKTRWMPMPAWDRSAGFVDAEALRGMPCYAGLDLAATTDLCALALLFPVEQDIKVLPFFWIPEDTMLERIKRDKVPYDVWVRKGYVTATPGKVVDYDFIVAKLKELKATYDLREIAFDRWGSAKIIKDLEELGPTPIPFGQGFAGMSGPTKDLMTHVLQGRFHHGGHPVLRWNADSVVVTRDASDNLKPDKAKSTQRIDGIVASIMGLDRALRRAPGGGKSVYETRGLATV
jgi:phage terminase large subunit-like protein